MRFVPEIVEDLERQLLQALCQRDFPSAAALLADDFAYRHWDGASLSRQALLQACMAEEIRLGAATVLDAISNAHRSQARSEARVRMSGRFFDVTVDGLLMGMAFSFAREEGRGWRITRIECLRAESGIQPLPETPQERAEYGEALWGATRFEGLFSDFADASSSLAQVLLSHGALAESASSAAFEQVSSTDAQAVLGALDQAARASLSAPDQENPLVSAALRESGLASDEPSGYRAEPAPAASSIPAASPAPKPPKLSAQQRSFIDSALKEVGEAIGSDVPAAPKPAFAASSSNPAFASAQDAAVSQALAAALSAEAFGEDESGLTASSGGLLLF